jgi:hypothetical protein
VPSQLSSAATKSAQLRRQAEAMRPLHRISIRLHAGRHHREMLLGHAPSSGNHVTIGVSSKPISLICRVSSAVEQRFCKPLHPSSLVLSGVG